MTDPAIPAAKLLHYAKHYMGCPKWGPSATAASKCECGLDDLANAVSTHSQSAPREKPQTPTAQVFASDPVTKLLPFPKIVERLREYARPDRDSGIYPMMLEVEEVRALLAGIDTSLQAAPQEAQWPCPKCGGTNYQHKSDCPRQARAQSTSAQAAQPILAFIVEQLCEIRKLYMTPEGPRLGSGSVDTAIVNLLRSIEQTASPAVKKQELLPCPTCKSETPDWRNLIYSDAGRPQFCRDPYHPRLQPAPPAEEQDFHRWLDQKIAEWSAAGGFHDFAVAAKIIRDRLGHAARQQPKPADRPVTSR